MAVTEIISESSGIRREEESTWVVGADLGQSNDPTALAVLVALAATMRGMVT